MPPRPFVSGAPMHVGAARTGIRRIAHAFIHSTQGLRFVWRTQEAFRQECLLLVPLSVVALVFVPSPMTKGLLVVSHLLILLIEILNTAIECVVDRIGPEAHPLSGAAKDLGSLAVLLAFATSGVLWIVALL